MEIKKVAESYNPIFKRKEVSFFIDHTAHSSPQLYEVRKSLAEGYSTGEDTVYVIGLETKTGTNRTHGRAEVYDSFEIAKKVVPKYLQMRNDPDRRKKEKAPEKSKEGEKQNEPATSKAAGKTA